MGRALIQRLLARNHHVSALARAGSEKKLPAGCSVVPGNALTAASFSSAVQPGETFVHLVGVAHPSPAKAREFREIDLVALKASAEAAVERGVGHFVYVSVARPAPVMREYQEVRAECEQIIEQTGLRQTILQPWYVLGPGHWWPYALLPVYQVLEKIPATRESAFRLGLVTLDQMVAALVSAVENPPAHRRVLGVPSIRAAELSPSKY